MTGMQPTPGLSIRADGSRGKAIPLERAVSGCGIDFIDVIDPYDTKGMHALIKRATEYVLRPSANPGGGFFRNLTLRWPAERIGHAPTQWAADWSPIPSAHRRRTHRGPERPGAQEFGFV